MVASVATTTPKSPRPQDPNILLQFFKSPLPSRLVVLLLLVLAVRLPLLWLGVPLSAVELHAFLIGERLHNGAVPYRDLYDSTAPLASTLYGLLEALGSRPLWLYRALALALLVVQAVRLNRILNRADVHPERGYVAALTYLLVASVTSDLDILSPLLVGHTLVVYALSALLPTSREGYDNRRLFQAGFLLGLAALFYLPLALFLVLALFAVIIFAANSFRSFLLLLCGFFFPYVVVGTVLLYVDALPAFSQFHLHPTLTGLTAGADGMPRLVQLRLLILPGVLLVVALLRTFATSLGLVFQVKFLQLMLVWLVVTIAIIIVGDGRAPGTLVLALPPLTYFGLFLWQRAQRPWLLELLLVVLIGTVVGIRYRSVLPFGNLLPIPAEESFAVQPNPAYASVRNQTLLVLGTDRRPYLSNRLVTPYLDWRLAQQDFGHLNEYAAAFRLAHNMRHPPAYLIDERNLLPELRYKLPTAFGRYEPTSTPHLFKLKSD
ncbi:hypothetical protein [Hymenobacter profundi]|uniref:Glycosyltransferase RgtA/B/C/D-like domain-containing protein n=1 Tax=Hymenobacter profundi TaxID=1982110 RepID=A0ABS6X4M2_9BACT|nr:hypothetical protein [Hymenobacter profundi]MBW3130412.1 hypothetical protein [Hymenobacter profundi]